MAHPLGIEPEGNYLIRGGPNIRKASLGSLARLTDALLLEVLGSGGVLAAVDLGRLALASKVLYCFANLEEAWKGMVLEELGGNFRWAGCWQRTYLLSTGRISAEEEEARRRQAEEEGEEESDQEEEEEQQQREADARKEAVERAEAATGESGRSSKRRKTGAAAATTAAAEAPPASDNGKAGTAARGRKGAAAAAAAATAAAAAKPSDASVAQTNGKVPRGKGKKCAPASANDDAAAGPGPSSTAAAAARTAAAASVAAPQKHRSLLRRMAVGGGGVSCLHRYLRVHGFYSDLLYQPWFCASLELPAEWLEVDNIDRRSGLTPEQFRREYEIPNRPVILQDVMPQWPAMSKWSSKYLEQVFGDREVIVGNMPVPFSTYSAYCAANSDEMPLYLFDKHFAETAPSLADDYSPPDQVGEDLFGLLGEQGRPDYRWLILGPVRSGSSFHVDPNATSAWNALLWGAKKWVMFPPGAVPPGVHPSPDGADVATPLSLTEWFVNFYSATQEAKVRPVEFIARPGDLLFVPRGWWHCALNLEESCAITQNFVSQVGLPTVLSFLRSRRPEMVSGCTHENRCNLYDRFVSVLREQRPAVLAAEEARQEEARAKARESNKLAALFKSAPSAAAATGAVLQPKATCGAATEATADGHSEGASGGERSGPAADNGGGGGGFSFGFSLGAGSAAASANGGEAGAGTGSGGAGFRFGFGL